jgi:hypothetical protein
MTESQRWLAERLEGAPADLAARMTRAVADSERPTIADTLAAAAWQCLQLSLRDPAQRASALDLLAADALLTHACEAAAAEGPETLAAFTEQWRAARFDQLLPSRVP